jgi:aspartate racemase
MPKITPPGGDVAWPEDEGILGVVGVAPWATLQFCQIFYSLIDARKDWHYPRVLLDINTKLPSRGRHLQLGERDPSPFIAETIAELAANGATVAVVACNTAHILFDRWAVDAPIPVINIIDAVIGAAKVQGAIKVATLASGSLAAYDLYNRCAEEAGLTCCRLSAEYQAWVSSFIEQVKVGGELSGEGLAKLDLLIDYLKGQGIDTVLLGCTELSVLGPRMRVSGFTVIDSNLALAEAAYAAIHAE